MPFKEKIDVKKKVSKEWNISGTYLKERKGDWRKVWVSYKLFRNLSLGDHDEIFCKFYAIYCKNNQDAYLQSLMEIAEVKQRKSLKDSVDERRKPPSHNFKYSPNDMRRKQRSGNAISDVICAMAEDHIKWHLTKKDGTCVIP
ncbi:hypothetical protein PR048_013095 [Dryococelus australis]|uniref:Uncharacterized protein n=1 Tax=Dryococelus australis TaxID=614101 RepID=A0ABQ9HSQ1_9NEOP|nr:hypothetical protein PR048_013095 [Dryococelus australis]